LKGNQSDGQSDFEFFHKHLSNSKINAASSSMSFIAVKAFKFKTSMYLGVQGNDMFSVFTNMIFY
jgi:hypothetical protein